MKKNNCKFLLINRRSLRKYSTIPEVLLWNQLRKKQINDYKFYRQFSVGKYILDFYCHKKRIAIEVDGDSHLFEKVRKNDQEKELFLVNFNIKVIRFYNFEIQTDMEVVLNKIRTELDNSPNPSLKEGN